MSISGAKAFSIFDDDDSPGTSPTAGTVVQFNHIEQNGTFYHRGIGEDDLNGSFIWAGDESMFEVGITETTGLDQIRQWMEDKTLLKMCLAGHQSNILWYEPTTVKLEKTFNFAVQNRNFHTVTMKVDKGGEHNIWEGINLLQGAVVNQGFNTGWQDAGADGKADGYLFSGTELETFTADEQKVDWDGVAADIRVIGELKLPISPVDLIFSVETTELFTGTGSHNIRIVELAYDNTAISSTFNFIGSVGRNSWKLITAPNIYRIQFYLLYITSITVDGQTKIKFPAIRVDDSEKYIAG